MTRDARGGRNRVRDELFLQCLPLEAKETLFAFAAGLKKRGKESGEK